MWCKIYVDVYVKSRIKYLKSTIFLMLIYSITPPPSYENKRAVNVWEINSIVHLNCQTFLGAHVGEHWIRY